jgi:hypothetical protein
MIMAVPRVLSIFKVRAEGNLEFWVSNFIIILSTVLGVYLAALAGYKTALEFEISRTQRESYFMRTALLDELKDNLEQAEKNADFIMNKDGWRFKAGPEAYKMQSFVWETMKQQSTTFQIPSELLTAVRRYYDNTNSYGTDMRAASSPAIEAAKALLAETKAMREKTLPAMEKDIARLREKLEKLGLLTD